MLIVGLTGPLGAGKSTVGRSLASRGAVVIDADQVARDVLAPGTPGEQAVLGRWGSEVTRPDGTLDRRALGRLVFSVPSERFALEALTHPLIRQVVGDRVAAAKSAGAEVAVLEIPLLDAGRRRQYGVDLVVLVDAPLQQCVRRAVERGIPETEARARIAAQPSDEQRRLLADRAISNTGDLGQLEAQVAELWDWLQDQQKSR